ncbi:MAG: Crp/Fnr family transcriptional regulator [Leptospirillia bacterium]
MSKTTMPHCNGCRISDKTVWASLGEDSLGELAEHRVASRYQRGDVIFHEGSPCTGLYNVCTGKVKLVRSGRVGRQTIVRIAGSGKTLAETDLFCNDGRHSVTAQAMEEVVVCFMPRPVLLDYLSGSPSMMMEMIRRLSDVLQKTERRVESLATKDARLRLAEFLVELAEEDGDAVEHGIRIRLRFTREEIAEVIGATLETTIRLMSAFKKEGILMDDAGHIVLLDTERLGRIHHGGSGPRSAR